MILFQDEAPQLTLSLSLNKQLDELLSDEYVLMNKTITLFNSLPNVPEANLLEVAYESLKKNVKEITAFLKLQQAPVHLSINYFIDKTRLSPMPVFTTDTSSFKHIISDHEFIISQIDDALISLTIEDAAYTVFADIKIRHKNIVAHLFDHIQRFKNVHSTT